MRSPALEVIRCGTILNRCPMDFADWTLNPYGGCAFGCSYCFVPAMKARLGVALPAPWGEYVEVKENAAETLRRQMRTVKPKERIAIGTATDPYQPAERTHRITRSLLEQLCFYDNPVSITTRSPLVLRDVDVLLRLANVRVNVSIPFVDDAVRRAFEPNAPAPAGRLECVRRLRDAGIRVSIFWAPVLPGVTDTERAMRAMLTEFAKLDVPVLAMPLRHVPWLPSDYEQRRRAYLRERGPDATWLRGGEVGRTMERLASELGVALEVSEGLYVDRRVPALRKMPGGAAGRRPHARQMADLSRV